MTKHIIINLPHEVEWDFSARPDNKTVWFHLFAGPMSGGVRLPPAKARALAQMLLDATDQCEIAEGKQ
jgi:hypothetical protein